MADESFVRLDYVIFSGVKGTYLLNSPIKVTIRLDPHFPFSTNDWIGLFKVGWTSVKEKVYSKNIPREWFNKLEWTFIIESGKLPKDEDEFYHLCYITKDEQLAGVSIPFQFEADDYDLIEDCEGSNSNEDNLSSKVKLESELEFLKRENEELTRRVGELVVNSQDPEGLMMALTCANNGLKEVVRELRKENLALKEKMNSSPSRVSLADARSYSFMDDYYNENNQEMPAPNNQPEVTRPIGFENLYPSTWVTYENHPDTSYPEPTWYRNPYINYQPGPSNNFKH